MYRIKITRFTLTDGTRKLDIRPKCVNDLEEYRKELKAPQYESINFVYDYIPDDQGTVTDN